MSGIKNFYLPLARRHVMADRWQYDAGTDFWLMPGLLLATATAGLNSPTANGWTMEAEHGVAGSAGDFRGGVLTPGTLQGGVPTTPGLPPHISLILTGDLIVSPPIFGNFDHMWAASQIAGKKTLPNKLVLECRAAFTIGSADEPTSGFGFFEDATTNTPATEGLQLAFISSNSANYQLATNASSTLVDVGALISVAWKTWKIVLDYDTAAVFRARWWIDGAYQGAIVPTTGEAPYAFGAHTFTTNNLKIGPTHIYYDWGD